MRRLLLFSISGLLSCGQNGDSGKQEPPIAVTATKAADTASTTPVVKQSSLQYITPDEGAVNRSLSNKFGTEWHVLNDKEATWMKDAFDYFIVSKRKEFPNYPYITSGDFNADGKQDTAAVVTDSLKTKYRIAILLAENKILFWDEDILEDAAISTVPRSEIVGGDEKKTKKIKLKGEGINIEYFEKASFVLYWDRSSFKRIQTGD